MRHFKNDYGMGAHPLILDALVAANGEIHEGYGIDAHCDNAAALIRRLCARADADVHFLSGGTQTNLTAIAAFLRPHEGVIAATSGHIADNETGAIEASGHKVITASACSGKLTPDAVLEVLAYYSDERRPRPRLLYLSNATEAGTVYTRAELASLREVCDREGLFLYLDGARLAQALASEASDVSFADIAANCDAFTFGGTKNGLLFGEALVITAAALKPDFRYLLKQRGAMLAKAHAMGVQFEALMAEDLWLTLARHANSMAGHLRKELAARGVAFAYDSPTNMLFPILDCQSVDYLECDFSFHRMEVTEVGVVIRLVCSWLTSREDCDAFAKAVAHTIL